MLGPLLLLRSACGGLAVASGLHGTGANDTSVYTAGDAVSQGDEQLRQSISLVYAGILEIALRALVNDVSHAEALDGLILSHAATTVDAVDVTDGTTTMLGSTRVSPLLGHLKLKGEERDTEVQ